MVMTINKILSRCAIKFPIHCHGNELILNFFEKSPQFTAWFASCIYRTFLIPKNNQHRISSCNISIHLHGSSSRMYTFWTYYQLHFCLPSLNSLHVFSSCLFHALSRCFLNVTSSEKNPKCWNELTLSIFNILPWWQIKKIISNYFDKSVTAWFASIYLF